MTAQDPFEPRRKPRQARSRATVEAICQAAAQVLVQEGYARATTNRIAEVAGVSVGTLYQYFPNKDALIVALMEEHSQEAISVLMTKLEEVRDAPPREAVRQLIQAMLALHAVNPALHKVLVEHLPQERMFRQIHELGGMAQRLVAAWLALHREIIVPEDLELASFVVVTTVDAITHATVLERPEVLAHDVLVDHLTRMVSRYLLE